MAEFLPISKSDMKRRGWAQCDFVYIIGCLLYTSMPSRTPSGSSASATSVSTPLSPTSTA